MREFAFLTLTLAVIAATTFFAMPAEAAREPVPIATDSRIRTILYNPNEVFKYVGHYGYQSSMEFAPDEEIQTVSIGDSVAWQVTPQGSRMFLKPIEQDADTNMTVITNLRTYHFVLFAKDAQSMDDKDMVFVVRFVYPKTMRNTQGMESGFLPDFTENPGRFNFNYTLSGPQHISPVRIFDDGIFTYFEFAPYAPDLPAVFMVGADGREALVNFRTRGSYIIVERVAARYTLRYGPETVCVYNETMLKGGFPGAGGGVPGNVMAPAQIPAPGPMR